MDTARVDMATLPAGMVALDGETVVRMASVDAMSEHMDGHDVYTTHVLMRTGGTLTVDADLDEVLRRINIQESARAVDY